MPGSAEQFVKVLEERGLVNAGVTALLRHQIGQPGHANSPHEIAQLLVKQGVLTEYQANGLLADVVAESAPSPPADAPKPNTAISKMSDDELDLAPLDDEPRREHGKKDDPPQAEEIGLLPLDDDPIEPLAPVVTPPPVPVQSAPPVEPPAGSSTAENLADDPLMHDDLIEAGVTLQPAKRPRRLMVLTSQWESPLMLLGSGILVLLLLLGIFLFVVLRRGSAEEGFGLAMENYKNRSYGQAILNFEKYLADFPDDVNASEARIRIGLAKLRQQTEGTTNWERALETAENELKIMEDEEQFATVARPELASLLPDIAEGFSNQARQASSTDQAQAFVSLYEQAMKLVDNSNYIPGSLRAGQRTRTESIQTVILSVQRDINREKKLVKTVEAINRFAEGGQTRKAYAARRELLRTYPSLERDQRLLDSVHDVSRQEREQVRVDEEEITSAESEHPLASKARITLAQRTGGTVAELADQVVYLLASGAVYGLRASNGQVLWRRFVGYEASVHPVPLNSAAGADAIVVDGRRHELLRLEATTGKLRWRLPVGDRIIGSVVMGPIIVLATESGRVVAVDAENGNSPRKATIPQPLNVSPIHDSRQPVLYVIGEHSSLYALSDDSLQCLGVFYVGHDAGSVVVPPVFTLGHVFVAENISLNQSQLHIVGADDNGRTLKRPQEPIALEGQVLAKPLVWGRRVLVVTSLGAVYLLETDSGDSEQPVKIVARTQPTRGEPEVGYGLVHSGQLWYADRQLTHFALQPSRGSIVRKSVLHENSAFLGPLRILGNTLFLSRRRNGLPGVSVAAISLKEHSAAGPKGDLAWETHLGVPSAGEVLVEEEPGFSVVSSTGAYYRISNTQSTADVADRPTTTVVEQPDAAFTNRLKLSDGRFVFLSESAPRRVLLYDPNNEAARLKLVNLQVTDGAMPAAACVFQDGLLVPNQDGRIDFLNALTGELQTHPFQPRLEPGVTIRWQMPVDVPGQPPQFSVADGRGHLYRVGIKDKPLHLVGLAQSESKCDLIGPLAVAGDTVYGVARGEQSDSVVSFDLPDLALKKEWDLEGRVQWGPKSVGDSVLVASDQPQLECFQAGQSRRWTAPLRYGSIVGRPARDAKNIMLASIHGVVFLIAGDTGHEVGKVEVGEPLGTGPVRYNPSTLLVTGYDGTLHAIPSP